ncbi:hypothetical protein NEOLEDRAFT_1028285, partial [Neolentinus lepideus HHB14362 ss-1]
VHRYYQDTLEALWHRDPILCPPFESGPFTCCCFNLGKQVWAFMHTDHLFGWCAITGVISFN